MKAFVLICLFMILCAKNLKTITSQSENLKHLGMGNQPPKYRCVDYKGQRICYNLATVG